MAENQGNQKPNLSPNTKPKRRSELGIMLIAIMIIIGGVFLFGNRQETPKELSYLELLSYIDNGSITELIAVPEAGENNAGIYKISGTLNNATEQMYISEVPTEEKLNAVIDAIEAYNQTVLPSDEITFLVNPVSTFDWISILFIIVPFIIVFIVIFFIMRSSGGNNKAFDFAKSRAKLNKGKTATFKDVAGCDEEKDELVEIIDFLKNPKKYLEIGARIPKGILLVGPPGTGKTLLARAVAGEASVPFYSISGSDFVEMFVGVGASRVRDMFKAAKQNAPCIVFIDEIDAVGRQRGAGLGGGHDEREQTLNQLLVEMDGFGANSGVIVIAATNRPDVLDPALLRPGRFDRQITINNPDVQGRTAILAVHARNKKIDPSVKFEDIARRTPGFSGADLENLLNEAALLAARENRKTVMLKDIDEAVDRVLMGPAKKSRKYNEKERSMIAHHEAGHAVVGIKLDNAEIVQKVTIVPRGKAGGYALMLDEEEKFLETKQSLLDRITGLLAGRVSEEINFGEITTGAHNDFQKATLIARAMVTEYGMSDLGPIQYERSTGPVFLGRDYTKDKNFSDQVALEIDREVRHIIDTCYIRCEAVIKENLELLKRIAHYLLEIETLTKEDIYEIVDTNSIKWWEEQKIAEEKAPKVETETKPEVEEE